MLEEDREILRVLARECKDGKERDRLRTLYILSLGESVDRVSAFFSVEESTVYRWIDKWKEDRNMADRPRDGRPQILNDKDKKEIRKLVEENDPKKHGMNARCWDTKELQRYFDARGRHISQECLRNALHKMGAHYVKAQKEYSEADKKEQEKFALGFLGDMKLRPHSVIVLFEDEMSASTSPNKGYGWTFLDRLVLKTSGRRGERVNCFGAVNPIKGEIIEMSSKDPKAKAFVRFLRKIRKKHKGTIWLYLDNLPVHKSAKVKKFIKSDGNIEMKFLPPYSPEMNIQEEWHNYKRKKLLNNHDFKSAHHLALSMSSFAKSTPPEVIRNLCSLEHVYRYLPNGVA